MFNLNDILFDDFSSQAPTSSFTNLTSLVGDLGSRIVAPLKPAINTTMSTYQRINQSMAGGWVINSIRENILECAGALGTAAIGQWVCSSAMGSVGGGAGHLLGAITAVGAGMLAGKATYSLVEEREYSEEAKLGESTIMGMATTALSSMILPGVGEQVGTMIGRAVGGIIGVQAGIILGGFAAVKLNGSEEVLINFQDPKNSYAIKTLQSIAVNAFLGQYWQFTFLIQAIQEQAVGSLSYHSLAVFKPTLESINEGQLLDDLLPNPPLLTQEEKQLIGEGIENIYQNSSNRKAALTFAAVQGISQDVLAPFFNQDLKDLYNQLSNIQSQNEMRMDEQQFMGVIMRSFENFLHFIYQNPEIQNAHRDLAAAFLAWQPEKEALEDSVSFKQAKQKLISILDDQASQHIKQHSSLSQWEKLQEVIDKDQVQELAQIIDQETAQKLTDRFMERLKQFEEKLFAFPLTNENLKNYVHTLISIHLQSFSLFFAFEASQPLHALNVETMRNNYQVINKLLANYYTIGVDARFFSGMAFPTKKMISSMQSLFDQQIKTAKFKDATLTDFIDLEPIVKSLKNS